ncbi:histidine phosphatase family protein [Lentzea sp. NPDC058450]|uniref:histidine phosphatase family protein n=1 Tax=Lentzea sp. NPDC058450 TaxID=3346505 RepID=UPI003656BA29
MPTRIVLVRHAQSVPPRFGEDDNDTRPLAPAGLEAADELVTRLVPYEPVAVLSSPQWRAVQTVRPTADALGLPVITWPELREWEPGLLPTPDWEALYSRSWADPTWVYGAGESLDTLTRRAGEALARIGIEYPDATVLVGSHGTFVSRALIAVGRHADFDSWRAMPMPAICEVTV